MTLNPCRPIRILLVEDSPSDAKLTLRALKQGRITNQVTHVEDGVAAMEYLRRQGEWEDAPRPDVVVLDLNLPRKDGREVLREIKQDTDLRSIPVVVMTTSTAEQDVLQTYDLHANCYVTKPVDFDKFLDIVRSIEHFWLEVVVLPTS